MKRVGFVGAGNMGAAIARGLVAADAVPPTHITVTDIDASKLADLAADAGVDTTESVETLASSSDAILLAVKPQSMADVLEALAPYVTTEHLVLSIAAGISTSFIEQRLGETVRVVRIMPNTPAMVRAGATALCRGKCATGDDVEFASRLFAALGTVAVVDEDQMDAVTAVSGSGPAYFFYLVEKLTAAGVEQGLAPETAAQLAAQTLYGAGKLSHESGVPPEELRARVTSKGGTTAAAVAVYDELKLGDIIARGVAAAVARSKELGK